MSIDPGALVGYIDAGTGSYLLAAVAGGIATMWFFIRAKVASLFGRKPRPQEAGESTADDEQVASAEADRVVDDETDSTTVRE